MLSILVVVEDERTAPSVAAAAAVLTAEPRRFILLAVAPSSSTPFLDRDTQEDLKNERREEFEKPIVLAREILGDSVCDSLVLYGHAGDEILRQLATANAGLVVVGRAKTNMVQRAARLTVSEYLLDHASCPVLVVRVDDP